MEHVRPYCAVLHGSVLRSYFTVSHTKVYSRLRSQTMDARGSVVQSSTMMMNNHFLVSVNVRIWPYLTRRSTVVLLSHVTVNTIQYDHIRSRWSYMIVNDRGCLTWERIRTSTQVDQSSCRNLKKPAGSGDFRVGSSRFSPLPTVSEPFLTGSLPPDSCRMFSDNSGNFPVGLQPVLSGTYRNR